MTDKKNSAVEQKNDGLGWITRSEPYSLEKYLNYGNFLKYFGPYQAFTTYTHRLFTTIARLPFGAQDKVDHEVETAMSQAMYRNYQNRIV